MPRHEWELNRKPDYTIRSTQLPMRRVLFTARFCGNDTTKDDNKHEMRRKEAINVPEP
jgi:hypothetical protein